MTRFNNYILEDVEEIQEKKSFNFSFNLFSIFSKNDDEENKTKYEELYERWEH
jgi:hypothetical protein